MHKLTNMHKLARIIAQMYDEATGCVEYAVCASELRESDRSLAETYMSMAKQELEHFERLEAHGAKLLASYESEHPNDTYTRELYAHQEEKALACAAEAKIVMEGWR